MSLAIAIHKKQALYLLAVILLVVAFVLLGGGEALAQLNPEARARGGVGAGDGSAVTNIARVVVNIMSILAGALAVVFIVIAGFRFATSSGDSSKVSSARSSIIYAAIGLIVVIFSQVIVATVLTDSTTAVTPAAPDCGSPPC